MVGVLLQIVMRIYSNGYLGCWEKDIEPCSRECDRLNFVQECSINDESATFNMLALTPFY